MMHGVAIAVLQFYYCDHLGLSLDHHLMMMVCVRGYYYSSL